MKLIIAETGVPPKELADHWPNYPAMFETMLGRAGARFSYQTVAVCDGEEVPAPAADTALLVTGSPLGVYEDHSFIAPLEEAVRAYAEAHRPVVGVCFGHQLVARAFGARVEKAEVGWAVGVHTYDVVGDAPWGKGPRRISCAVSHQDQVLSLPAGMRRVAGSPFTPFGVLAHQSLPVLTFQPHPEFDHGFAEALLTLRSDRVPEDRSDLGLATLKTESDRDLIGVWIKDFLETAGG